MTEQSNRRYEPASPAWVNALRQFLKRKFTGEDLTGVTYPLSWEVTHPPSYLRKCGSNSIGFAIRRFFNVFTIYDAKALEQNVPPLVACAHEEEPA